MADKDFRRLSKTDLLELLIEQGRENLALKARLEEAEAELAQRKLQIKESGSIAEAALKLTGVFESAQKAIDLYRENCERQCREMVEEAKRQAAAIRAGTSAEEREGGK
ncbi:MAG: hypothetical protein ACI4MG_08165 [Aristaeellaceae bacterium]